MQRLQAAVALHNQGELDQAEAIYRNILTVDMNNFYALNFYGCICRERKRFDEGIDLLSRATSLQPGNPDAFYNLGNVLKDAERWNEAISCYEKTLGLRAEYPEALNNLGICLMEVERYEHSEIVLSRAVSMQPDFAGAWLNLGNTFKEQDKLEQAIGSYRKAIEEKPDFADAYLALGIFLKEDGEVEEAIRSYRKAIEVKPDFADAYLALGIVLKKGGEVEEAIRSYRKAIEVKPDFADVYLNLGIALKEEGEVEEAIRSYRKAIEVKPDFADAYLNLGNVLKEGGEVEEAIAIYRKAIEVKADFADVYLNLGIALKEEGEVEEAIRSYRKAIEVKPDFADAYLNLGNVLKEGGEVEKAIASYRKATEVKPDFADAYLNLGNVLKEGGEAEEAIGSYRKAIDVKPDFVDAYLQLGAVFVDVGRIDEARQIVTTLRQMKFLGDEASIAIKNKTLVFDWHHRRAMSLLGNIELAAAGLESSSLVAVRRVQALCFPPLFLRDQAAFTEAKILYENGYLVDKGLISSDLCSQFISQLNDVNEPMSAELVEAILADGVLRAVLERIFFHTGFPHLIWNCIYFSKAPKDASVSDTWHYDNHYSAWTPKLMIYLNSQKDEGGATQFVDAGLSRQISEISDYMGLLFQRESYVNQVRGLAKELNLDPVTLDPEHYIFSPECAGSGVWFCPARVLHRGVSPKNGVRHVLSFSLTPLPTDCGLSVDYCVEKSTEILLDKIKQGMQKNDANPYWMSSEVGSN